MFLAQATGTATLSTATMGLLKERSLDLNLEIYQREATGAQIARSYLER